jgi:hypothetical protein
MPTYVRHLQYLDISDCDHISDKCLKWIASSCTELTSLNLRFCPRITNGGLYDLSLGSQSFTSLKFSHCNLITDASIIFFSDSIKDLREIYLRRCRKLTDNTAKYIIKVSPRLKVLDMTACPYVTKPNILPIAPSTLKLVLDKSMAERGVKSPAERGAFVAVEIPIHKRFTSGPRDIMAGKKQAKGEDGDASKGSASPSSKKKKKSSNAMMIE